MTEDGEDLNGLETTILKSLVFFFKMLLEIYLLCCLRLRGFPLSVEKPKPK